MRLSRIFFFSVFSLLLFEPHLDNFYNILLIFSLICYLAISFLACHVIIHPHLSLSFVVIFVFPLGLTYNVLYLIAYRHLVFDDSSFPPICLIPLFKFLGVCSSCRYQVTIKFWGRVALILLSKFCTVLRIKRCLF